MHKVDASWGHLIESIEVHRDVRARYFKPVCIIAVCDLIDKGVVSINEIPAALVIKEFESLVFRIFPKKAGNGWMPMWHLMRDGAWICKKEGNATSREVFPYTKPRSKKETLEAIDTIDCSYRFGNLWPDVQSRTQLRAMMCSILLSDEDENANIMGEYLIALNEIRHSKHEILEITDLGIDELVAIESYALFRVHTKIERNSRIPKEVKRLQGYSCLACGFNFEKVYGNLGLDYIEAHHVNPVYKNKGIEKKVNLLEDFLVLCSNCHKMIHAMGCPSIEMFKLNLQNPKDG